MKIANHIQFNKINSMYTHLKRNYCKGSILNSINTKNQFGKNIFCMDSFKFESILFQKREYINNIIENQFKILYSPINLNNNFNKNFNLNSMNLNEKKYSTQIKDNSINKEFLLEKITSEYKHLLLQYGFSQYAIIQLFKELGYESQMIHVIITPLDIIEYIIEESNKRLSLHFQSPEIKNLLDKMSTKQKLKILLQYRLELVSDYVKANRWHEAMALWFIPGSLSSWNRNYGSSESSDELTKSIKLFLPEIFNYLPNGEHLSRALWHWAVLSDELVFLSELGSAKINQTNNQDILYDFDITSPTWYIDRAAIASLYISSELFMLTDGHEDFKDTWDFIDRNVDTFLSLRSAGHLAKEFSNTIGREVPQIAKKISFEPEKIVPIVGNFNLKPIVEIVKGIAKSVSGSQQSPRFPRYQEFEEKI